MAAEPSIPKMPLYAFPAFVTTDAERERWELAHAIAAEMSAQMEPSGVADPQFVLYMTPTIYHSEHETGDAELPVEEADGGDEADRLWAELEATKPGDDVTDPEVHWAHVGRVADLFDELFGDPDELDLDSEKLGIPRPGEGISTIEEGEVDLEELFAHVFRGAYRKDLHPRDRMGKWSRKLNGVRAFAAAHRDRLREHVAAAVAAAALKREVSRSDKKGALAGDIEKAHDRHTADAERLKAHAAEQRARQGVSGARQQAIHHAHRAKGHALVALAYVMSEEAAAKAGKARPFHEEFTKDAGAALDEVERARTVKDLAHESARYAMEHRHELSHVVRVAKHVGHAALRAKGLAHADVTDEDEAAADFALDAVAGF